jgi:hypothetical protein
MAGELILRGLVFIIAIPAIAAPVAYFRDHPTAAVALNGALPLLVLAGSALAILNNPSAGISAGGMLYFAFPLVALVICALGFRLRMLYKPLFWCAWLMNLAMVSVLFYLSFLFRIRF